MLSIYLNVLLNVMLQNVLWLNILLPNVILINDHRLNVILPSVILPKVVSPLEPAMSAKKFTTNNCSLEFLTLHHLVEKSFGQNAIWSKSNLVEKPFGQKAIWSKSHFVEKPFGQKVIWSKSHLVECLGWNLMEQHALINVNNHMNTNIYSFLETSGGQSSNLY